MRIPQVSDRMKEAPVQALRATFASIGQFLLAADRLWSRSEPGAPAGPPATPQGARAPDTAVAEPRRQPQRSREAGKPAATQRGRQPRKAPVPEHQPSRWRSLDETGNVRLLSRDDVDEELTQRAGLPAEPPAAGLLMHPAAPSLRADPGASLQVDEQAASAAILPGEPEPVTLPESSAAAEPAAAPEPAAFAEPAPPGVAALPVPSYDGLSIASLRARLRNLDTAQLRVLADYERAGQARADVLTMFERRIAKLEAAG